ncbi:hypothetical protein FAES_4624 [Fibrella aestuarina BUZ 2]|uniref:Uncharacterized protein n=1 Tax=Fibrella aestuarina BUZ 2 TaxID=1166018 RepID=I0KES0_9BACT|nr:sigma-70 family RNA polymerase sigma factor [Fibrella aestuarina]CCH02623.1 hypothetical protein FAES_4624 [Fibrella aestuarina BUZ 2]
MNVLNRSVGKTAVLETANTGSNRLRLYERYGAVAHGVILKIVPNPQQAQDVLIEVFAAPELQADLPFSASTTCTIIRLARKKALEYRQNRQLPTHKTTEAAQQAEHIFNLLFYHNQSPESIAEGLQIQRPTVFRAVREFFGFSPSHKSY